MIVPTDEARRNRLAGRFGNGALETRFTDMIARIESRRKSPPLHPTSAFYHELERVTAAWEQARALAHYPLADALLKQRNALMGQLADSNERAVAQ